MNARETPLIAIVGRPNVGKSTFFNRLVGGRPALVHDTPGLTRDRRYGEFEYYGHEFRVVDTGGLDPDAERDVIGAGIHRQAHLAMEEAAAIIFIVDINAGVTPVDEDLARMLRRLNKPIVLAANKADSAKRRRLIGDIFSLGLGEVYPMSAAHGLDCDDVIEAVIEALALPPPERADEAASELEDSEHDESQQFGALRVAFIGKPNAGKSSLVNRFVGVERALVHHEPGTTTDPSDTPFQFAGRDYLLVDTAGIRRRARIDEETEKIAVSMALAQLKRVHVAVLVIDGNLGPSEQDARLAGAIAESGRAVVIALNKSDLLDGAPASRALREQTKDNLHFLSYAPIVFISALRGDGVTQLMTAIDRVAEQHRKRVTTAELNKFFETVLETHPPPLHRSHAVRIHFLAQPRVRPPTFVLWVNRPDGLSPSYRRYVANQLRQRYGFEGTPIRVLVRAKRRRPSRKKGAGSSFKRRK